LQTCKVKSAASQVHDWVVYHLGGIFGSVGHRVKIHKITPATGLTHTRCGSSHVHTTGQLTNTRRSDGVPELDGALREVARKKLFLHAHREASTLTNEIPEESGQFRFLRVVCYANIKGSVGLILAKASAMRISIPLKLSSRPFIPLPRFICRRRPLPLLASSLVFTPRCSV
jgi:hypothetical protein